MFKLVKKHSCLEIEKDIDLIMKAWADAIENNRVSS
jgi:hypothetical protein